MVASQARDAKLAGATVLEALIGFGRSAHVHRRHVLESDRAVVIEIIDEESRLRAFAATLSDVPEIALITLEAIEIIGGGAAPVLKEMITGEVDREQESTPAASLPPEEN